MAATESTKNIPDEALHIHNKLGADLSNFIFDHDLKQLKTRCKDFNTPREYQQLEDFIDIFQNMTKKGFIKIGDYSNIKFIIQDYNTKAYAMILETEKRIKDICSPNENNTLKTDGNYFVFKSKIISLFSRHMYTNVCQ